MLDDLLRAVATGDRRAFRTLYQQESPRLYGVAMRMMRSPTAASDVLQEAFLQVWRNADRFDPERGSAGAWLVSLVRYRALDALERSGREIPTDDPNLGDAPVEFDPVAAIDGSRDATALRRCLQVLEDKNRQSIVLAFVEGLSHSQVAQRLGTPLGTVKAWIRRGLQNLKSCLEAS